MDKLEYYKNLPKKRISAGVLLFNEAGQLLILELSYKDHWSIPGGVVEAFESPIEGAKREIREEIGLDIELDRCLAVDYTDYILAEGHREESLQFLFLGKTLSEGDMEKIKIDKKEIVSCRFADFDEALGMLGEKLSRRLSALNGNFDRFRLLKNGEIVV